jgi:hypothetical protein
VRTTATAGGAQALVTKPPTLDSVAAKVDLAVAGQLHLVRGAGSQAQSGTLIASNSVPPTRAARGAVAAMSGRGALADGQARLLGLMPDTNPARRAA